jgi:tRNA threonylcarbamoyladenosine biosynthesis protein TsaB
MIVLGLDTSAYANAVGVVDGERVLAEATFTAKTDSLEQIVANIDEVLKRAGLTLDTMQGIGVGLGPGSWTGIRVGVTVGKMLAFSTGKPVCGITTLEALAYGLRFKSGLICAVISAGIKDAVYAAVYRPAGDGLAQLGDYYVGSVQGLAALINEPVLLAGDGVLEYTQALPGRMIIKTVRAMQGGAAVASLAAQRLEKGRSDEALSLTPLYLKESTARALTGRYTGAKGQGGML